MLCPIARTATVIILLWRFSIVFLKDLAKLNHFTIRSCDFEKLYTILPKRQKMNRILLIIQTQ